MALMGIAERWPPSTDLLELPLAEVVVLSRIKGHLVFHLWIERRVAEHEVLVH